nr:zinc finger protein 260-like [Oryctolagus cuniculus]
MIAFEDLAVYFMWEEWKKMNNAQKILYRDVMLETYSSLFSLGYCTTKPDLIFKLERGAEPWMVDECLNRSLPVVMKRDDLIRINQENQDKNLNQDFMENNKTSALKRVELRKTPSLNSSHIPTLIIEKGTYSGLNPEKCNKCHTVYCPSGPEQLQVGEKFDNTKIPGNCLQFCEPLGQHDNIHITKQPFGPIGQAKVFTRKMFCKSERVHMAENCDKSTVTFGKATQIEKAIHENYSLSMHQQSHTRKKFYRYIRYVEPVIHQSHLAMNQILNTREKLYKCKPSGKSLSFNSPYECNDCGKAFGQKSDLRKHQQIHTGEKPHKCNDCGKNFGQKSHLFIHQRIHTGEKPHECNDCGKAFTRKSDLILHQRIHTGEKPHKCNDCGKAFIQKSHLIVHQRIHTGQKPHKCNDCGKAFGQKSDLRKHQKIHTGEKPHKCNDCGKNFGRKSHLFIHQRIHTGEKPHKCNDCGKAFGKKSYLILHQRIHTGEKPHKCNDCGKAFIQKSQLIVHQRIHTGQKPHECNDCGKGFARKSAFILHQRIHTGEKPHKCNDCGKAFGRKSDLIVHQRNHTEDKPF